MTTGPGVDGHGGGNSPLPMPPQDRRIMRTPLLSFHAHNFGAGSPTPVLIGLALLCCLRRFRVSSPKCHSWWGFRVGFLTLMATGPALSPALGIDGGRFYDFLYP